MARKVDLVVTTIFEPAWLEGYLDDLRGSGLEVTVRIIGDRKTPSTVWTSAKEARAAGFDVVCPTLDEQEAYLARIGVADDFIPWNSDNRRNVGFLQAWENGADVMISIDDDNFCRAGSDFFRAHLVVGETVGQEPSLAGDGWFNICSLLDIDGGADVYPRGFPYFARSESSGAPSPVDDGSIIAFNAGLWLRDPDVDAITRLTLRPCATGASEESVIIGPGTWTPINTQNTAVIRDAIPAYYYIRMGFPIQGMRIDRYGDILSGYFLQKCSKHLNHVARVGTPVADHVRTPHNLMQDLYHELAGMVLIEEVVPWLQEVGLSGSTYAEVYASLADALEDQVSSFTGFVWDQGGRDFLSETAGCMREWLKVVDTLA